MHEGARDFLGERWNQINVGTPKARDDAQAAERYGLQSVRSDRRKIPHLTGSTIAQGANSGYQAVNLVALWGATDILLLGFDMRVQGTRRHYFGDHPRPLSNASPFPLFLKAFEAAAPVYAAGGVVIRNATPGSALKCFPYVDLEKALA